MAVLETKVHSACITFVGSEISRSMCDHGFPVQEIGRERSVRQPKNMLMWSTDSVYVDHGSAVTLVQRLFQEQEAISSPNRLVEQLESIPRSSASPRNEAGIPRCLNVTIRDDLELFSIDPEDVSDAQSSA